MNASGKRILLLGLLALTAATPDPRVSFCPGIAFDGKKTFVFTLPHKKTYTGIVEVTDQPDAETQAWAGRLKETAGAFTLIKSGKECSARIHVYGQILELTPDKGILGVEPIDTLHNQFRCASGEDIAPVTRSTRSAETDPCAYTKLPQSDPCYKAEKAMAADAKASLAVCKAGRPSPHQEITAVVTYTQAVANAYGGRYVIASHIRHSVEETNLAFHESGIDAHLSIAAANNTPCIFQVNYNESGDFFVDLGRLLTPDDGQLDDVPRIRNKCHGDVAMLLLADSRRQISGKTCVMTSLGVRYKPYAYAVLHYNSMINSYVFTHELGHMLGAGHDRNDGCRTGMCPDAAGWHFQYDGKTWKTMMARDGERALNFSDPQIHFNGSGPPTGAADANNARTLRMSVATVAGFE